MKEEQGDEKERFDELEGEGEARADNTRGERGRGEEGRREEPPRVLRGEREGEGECEGERRGGGVRGRKEGGERGGAEEGTGGERGRHLKMVEVGGGGGGVKSFESLILVSAPMSFPNTYRTVQEPFTSL